MNLITTAALAACEKIINKALEYDPATRAAISNYEGKVIAINISAPPGKFFIYFQRNSVRLMSEWQGSVDTHISGSLLALAQLATTPVHNLKDTGVTATGDLQLLASLQKIAQSLDIDWEEMLTTVLGDVMGHQVAVMIRKSINWQRQQAGNLQRLTGEFVTEELQAIPSQNQLESFYQEVDELRLAVDRLAARINLITASATHE